MLFSRVTQSRQTISNTSLIQLTSLHCVGLLLGLVHTSGLRGCSRLHAICRPKTYTPLVGGEPRYR